PGRVPRGRRQVRRGRVVDRVSLACAGPPGRPSVLPHGGGRGAVLGRRENRSDGGKIPILPLVVLRIGFPLETEKKRKNGTRSSRNPGLLPPFVSRISFPCKQWIEQRKLLPKYSRNRGSSRPDRFENWLYLKAGKKAGNERGRSSRNRGGAVMVQSGLPPLGVQGSEPRVKPSRGERGPRPGAIAHAKPFRGQISGSSSTG